MEKNRKRIESNYEKLRSEFPQLLKEADEKLKSCRDIVGLAVRYLYTAMPLSDMANYSYEVFLDFARHGAALWEEKAWVRELPEEIYLNYVLLHRVNEEEIRPCRKVFAEKLEGRISGMTMEETIIEVNYWCAEQVTYHCGDERTLSALAVCERGYGRCGEESVFTVNALRSVGIPARQVYVPRWSHCDDNHAWVEAWSDGTWKFLGACEPQMVLNRGWFTEASSRAMVLHARLFDPENTEESVIGQEGMAAMLNELERYAAVQEIEVLVRDEKKQPIADASVEFEILNSGEYYPAAVVLTNEQGIARLKTGYGSLHLWLLAEGYRGSLLVDTREKRSFILEAVPETEYSKEWEKLDFYAPHDTPVNTVMPTPEQKELGSMRLKKADRLRTAAKSNWKNTQLEIFLEKGTGAQEVRCRKAMLDALSEKDRTDVSAALLEEYFEEAAKNSGEYPEEIYNAYVLNPRVEHEILMPCRSLIKTCFTQTQIEDFRCEPEKIWNWIDCQIKSYPQLERASVITTPLACLQSRTGSEHSKWILFVAVARTFGIPARLNPESGAMEYWKSGAFVPVLQSEEKTAKIRLKLDPSVTWKYFQNWSIARLVKGSYVSLQYWNLCGPYHTLELQVCPGQYRLLTTNRLPNGNQLVLQKELQIAEGETKEEVLKLRETVLEEMLEKIIVPEFYVCDENGKRWGAAELTSDGQECGAAELASDGQKCGAAELASDGRECGAAELASDGQKCGAAELTSDGREDKLAAGRDRIFFWLEERREPTEHILNELLELKEEFKKVSGALNFVVRSGEALQDPTLKRVLQALPDIRVYYDSFEENIELLARRMYVNPEQLPLIIVFSGSRTGIYACSGYQVGTGAMLLSILNR
ncbi:MAG: transglutaminase domain-containing protein [Lachnospiraceae bacterium]|nr:transglutaminase domain-containing protein [Lachnospiraceae bacterium]